MRPEPRPAQELILFGNSPFITDIDIPALLRRYQTIGINGFSTHFPVDWVFMYDRFFDHAPSSRVIVPHWFRQPVEKVVPKALDSPVYPRRFQNGLSVVGFKYFTVSIAVNWAIQEGFKSIYLVGIDHHEEERQFRHFDGETSKTTISPTSHQALKRFVEKCAKVSGATIYQCNPDAEGWKLPYLNLETLYGPTRQT